MGPNAELIPEPWRQDALLEIGEIDVEVGLKAPQMLPGPSLA